jgi:arabinan endo-1,5-alpha-L-arabinosidase
VAGPGETPTPHPPAEPTPEPIVRGIALDRDFADPTVIRVGDQYYAYGTQTESDDGYVNIQVARSPDLKTWTYLGEGLPNKPAWGASNQSYWAPHVVEKDGVFYLYYSAVPDDPTDGENCLAVATSEAPEGPFTDAGEPVYCSYEIDPMVFNDPVSGRWFMYWGSAGDIAVQEMDPDMLHLSSDPKTTLLLGWNAPKDERRPYEHGIEGPFVIFNDGWYYLFYSGDRCCEYPPRYALMVARSRAPDGPFTRIGDAQKRADSSILADDERWKGPGHCSVVSDPAGLTYVAFHAIDERKRSLPSGYVRRVMHIRRLRFEDGWPVVGEPLT